MNLNLKPSSLADLRLEILTQMDSDLEASFLELLELRERVREAEQLRSRTPALIKVGDPERLLLNLF
jgi:hypothetical protein